MHCITFYQNHCATNNTGYHTMGAFHYAKDSGNFGRNSNGKVHFGFLWPECSGSPLEVGPGAHHPGGPHISVGIFRPKFDVPYLTNRFFALIREFGKRIKNDNINFYWLARFYRKMPLNFPKVFPLISDRSVWHNGSTLCFRLDSSIRICMGKITIVSVTNENVGI